MSPHREGVSLGIVFLAKSVSTMFILSVYNNPPVFLIGTKIAYKFISQLKGAMSKKIFPIYPNNKFFSKIHIGPIFEKRKIFYIDVKFHPPKVAFIQLTARG